MMRCHHEGELLQVTGMANTTAYPGTLYERWCWLIQAPDRANAYAVDLSYLTGGGTFDYNTMGLDCSFERVQFSGIDAGDWTAMSGTLAGEDVPLYSKPGHGWMKAERSAIVEAGRPVNWTYRYDGAGLTVHAVPPADRARQLVCCLGERGGEEMGKSRWEPFVLWRDHAKNGGEDVRHASFAAVLEPFERTGAGESGKVDGFIEAVRPLTLVGGCSGAASAFQPVGMEIAYRDGRHKDIVMAVHELAEDSEVVFRDSGGTEYATDAKALLLRYCDGVPVELEAIGCTRVTFGSVQVAASFPALTGIVSRVDLERREVQVHLCGAGAEEASAEWLQGRVAIIDSPDYGKPSTYVMHDVAVQDDMLTFRSAMSLINLDADWKQPFKRLGLGTKREVLYEGRRVLADLKAGDTFKVWNTLRRVFR